jgi:hypothetical protein
MNTRRQRTRGNSRAQRNTRALPDLGTTRGRGQRARNELDHGGTDVDWNVGNIVESMVGTKIEQRGVITRITRCSVDVRWPGNVMSNKPKASCLIVTEEVRETRAQSIADADDPEMETFAMEAFPVLAQLMVRGAVVYGVTSEEFDDLLESLRLQFETADLSGLVNHSVERGVMD